MATASVIGDIAASAPEHLKQQLRAAWNMFTDSVEHSVPHLVLPGVIAERVGIHGLEDIMRRFSNMVAEDVHLQFDPDINVYLMGPLLYLPSSPRISSRGVFRYNGRSLDSASMGSTEIYHITSNPTIMSPLETVRPSPRGAEKIRKPANAWILYRQHKHIFLKSQHSNMPCAQLSKIISAMWRNETPEVKARFNHLAEVEKQKHQMEHPNWKCSPRKSSTIKKRNRTTSSKVTKPMTSQNSYTTYGTMFDVNTANTFPVVETMENSPDIVMPEQIRCDGPEMDTTLQAGFSNFQPGSGVDFYDQELIDLLQSTLEAANTRGPEPDNPNPSDAAFAEQYPFLKEDETINDLFGGSKANTLSHATDPFRCVFEETPQFS